MYNCMIQNETKKNGNVLLLTMSTLPEREELQATEYKYKLRKPVQGKEGYIKFKGYSQLEPIPVSLAWRLAARNEQLDKIVVINNKETVKPRDKVVIFSDNKEEYRGISAFDFFKLRVESYMHDSIEFYSNNSRVPLDKVRCKTPEIVSVKIDDTNAIPGIYEVCDILRSYNQEYEKLNLFLDIHGGLRSQQIMVDAVISILEHEGINIHETYSTKGNPPTIEIINANDSINIFNLVSGVNEFIFYGRSKSLVEYIEGIGEGNNSDKELISAINEICESLQLCRMDEFSENVARLKEAINLYEKVEEGKLSPIIKLIKQNYLDLFKNENDLVSQIEWCVKHEFYQQALTIIESLIPGYLFYKKVVWYEAERSRKTKILIENSAQFNETILCRLEKSNLVTSQLEFDKFVNHCKNWWVEIENYIFENCTECVNEHEKNGKRKAVLSLQKTKEEYFNIPLRFDGVDTDEYVNEFKANKIESDNNYKWLSKIWLKTAEEKQDIFNRFAQIHFMLKNQRNLTNHAKTSREKKEEERANVEQIKMAIEAYVDLLKKLLKQ